jgi:cystathionine beta-lyase/cystathionine gamma-synthase
MESPDDICPRPARLGSQPTQPLAPAIQPASVWICRDTDQANRILAGQESGYVYQRDGHPNADLFAEKCRELHAAESVAVTASGMAALALALLSQVDPGQHVVVSNRLYGRSSFLFTQEAGRLGISSEAVDTTDLAAVERALEKKTALLVVETISNPRLAVADIAQLSELAHRRGAKVLVDNSFATPILCRPMALGADLVMESVTKMMNGHSDVSLGMLAGRRSHWERVPLMASVWGLASSPFDCWLAMRGLATLPLRMDRACENARLAAEYLASQPAVESVDYPGRADHPQHALASRQFSGRYGCIVTFHLSGGRKAVDAFMERATGIPFCPSLGELSTTLSHPESTSHRGLSADDRAAQGISGGTIRLSVGVESPESIQRWLAAGLSVA